MKLDEANEFWFVLQPIEGVRFRLNDAVRITGSEHSGSYASVISLISLEPVSYLIELSSGQEIKVFESEIEISE